jgi:amino acid transporter
MRREYLIAIILAVAALPAGAALMVAPEYLHLTGLAIPATFWGGIAITIILIFTAIAVALRGSADNSKPERWKPGWVVAIVLLFVIGTAGYFIYHWPISFVLAASDSDSGDSRIINGPMVSRLSHFLLQCDVPPPPPEKTATDTVWELHDYKQKLDVIGQAIGVGFTMVTILGGVRIEAEAVTEEAKQRIPLSKIGVNKITIEIRRVEKYELVSVIIKLPPQYSFYEVIAPNPAAPDTVLVVRTVERFLGVKTGACQVI